MKGVLYRHENLLNKNSIKFEVSDGGLRVLRVDQYVRSRNRKRIKPKKCVS